MCQCLRRVLSLEHGFWKRALGAVEEAPAQAIISGDIRRLYGRGPVCWG